MPKFNEDENITKNQWLLERQGRVKLEVRHKPPN